MKKLLVLLFLFVSIVFAQTEKQNIELPDFIITGRQALNVQSAQKPKTELITILSKEFFTPPYSPEELPLLISSSPVAVYPSIKSSQSYFNGNVKLMLGKETFPFGLLNLSHSYDYYLMNLKAWGTNINEYKPNANYNSVGIELSNEFSVSTRSDYFPGSKFFADVKYYRDSYYMYGSVTSNQLRIKNLSEARISFANMYSKIFNLSLGVGGDFLSFNENGLIETNILLDGKINFRWSGFMFGGKAQAAGQMLSNNLSGIDSYNNLSAEGFIELQPAKEVWINTGVYFNTNSNNNMIAPFVSAEFLLDKGFTIGAQYKPHVELLSMKNILGINPFTRLSVVDNTFEKYHTDFTASVRYEYQKVFSVSAEANYAMVDGYLYFQDITSSGKYDALTSDRVTVLKSKISFFLQPQNFGSLFAEAVLQDVKDAANNIIPFEPLFTSSLSYNYNLTKYGFGIKYRVALQTYTNLINTNKLNDYANVSTSFWYEAMQGLKLTADFQNILNRSNFVWKYYQEKPFDILFGFEYRW